MTATAGSRLICVIGAASGIGRATAERFLCSGDAVLLVDRDTEGLAAAVGGLKDAYGARALGLPADVSVEADVVALAARLAELGGLDCLVLAAAVTSDGLIAHTSSHDWSYIMSVNLTGPFFCLRHTASQLQQSGGAVVAVGSVSSDLIGAGGGCAAYEASKAGLVQLVRAFAVENAPYGVRANVVSPGRIGTQLGQHAAALAASVYTSADGPRRTRHSFVAPLRKEGRPDEVADVIHFLAGDQAGYVTASTLLVDGGYSAI